MRYINNLSEELEVFKALGSEVRISILNLLLERGKMSMNELAEQLDITNGAMTNHIRKLESADLIRVTSDPNVHGNLKLCEPHLDKILFILNRGEHYYVWAEKVGVGKKISNLYIAKMQSPYKLKTAQVLLTTPDYDRERVGFWVNEGPFLLKHDGKLFLTFSASETGIDYCVGMLTADEDADLLDPASWKKSRYPVLRSDASKKIYGPGHNCFVKSEDGSKDLMIYHARTETEIIGDPLYNPNRHAMVMEVKWAEDGTPVFSYE